MCAAERHGGIPREKYKKNLRPAARPADAKHGLTEQAQWETICAKKCGISEEKCHIAALLLHVDE